MEKQVPNCHFFFDLPIGDQKVDDNYEQIVAHRLLWRAVIDQMVDDILAPDWVIGKKSGVRETLTGNALAEVRRDRKHAELWASGHIPFNKIESGIQTVSDLAGLDAAWVKKKVKELTTPASEATQ